MDGQRQRLAERILLRPVDDELLGVSVQVFVDERRRVHRVEELVRLVQLKLNSAFHLAMIAASRPTGKNRQRMVASPSSSASQDPEPHFCVLASSF
jgi:hypothetical protein